MVSLEERLHALERAYEREREQRDLIEKKYARLKRRYTRLERMHEQLMMDTPAMDTNLSEQDVRSREQDMSRSSRGLVVTTAMGGQRERTSDVIDLTTPREQARRQQQRSPSSISSSRGMRNSSDQPLPVDDVCPESPLSPEAILPMRQQLVRASARQLLFASRTSIESTTPTGSTTPSPATRRRLFENRDFQLRPRVRLPTGVGSGIESPFTTPSPATRTTFARRRHLEDPILNPGYRPRPRLGLPTGARLSIGSRSTEISENRRHSPSPPLDRRSSTSASSPTEALTTTNAAANDSYESASLALDIGSRPTRTSEIPSTRRSVRRHSPSTRSSTSASSPGEALTTMNAPTNNSDGTTLALDIGSRFPRTSEDPSTIRSIRHTPSPPLGRRSSTMEATASSPAEAITANTNDADEAASLALAQYLHQQEEVVFELHQARNRAVERIYQLHPPTYLENRQREEIDVDNMTYEQLLALGEQVGDVKQERWREVSVQVLSRLPIHRWTSSNTADISCIICQYNFKAGDVALTLPCAHVFHDDCVTGWVRENNSCPLCKLAIAEI